MRKVNGKLFLALLLGTGVLVGAVFAVHHFQYQRIARALLWQAQRAEEQGETKRMAQYLQRYLEFNPRDTAEKAKLARTWAGDDFSGDVRARRRALRLLDEVLIQENDPELRRLAVKVALELGRSKAARDHLEVLLPFRKVEGDVQAENVARMRRQELPKSLTRLDKERGELDGFWGQVHEAEGKSALAIGCYRLASRRAPDEQLSPVRLAHLLRRANEPDPIRRAANVAEADRAIRELASRPDAPYQALLARWRYRRDFDILDLKGAGTKGLVPLEEAAEDVAVALKRKPNSVDVLLAAADLERLRGRGVMETPSDAPLERRQEELQEHRKKAFDYLKKGLELAGRQKGGAGDYARFQLLWHKANLLLDDVDRLDLQRDQAGPGQAKKLADLVVAVEQTIEQVRQTRMPAASDYLRGRLLIHERRWAEAATRFERARTVLAGQPDLASQANIYLGQCYERLEEPKLMEEAYKRVANLLGPTSTSAVLGMASALWAQGKLVEAREQLHRVVRTGRVPPRTMLDLARLELQIQLQEDDPRWQRVMTAIDNAAKVNPKAAVEVALLRAEVELRSGKREEAEKRLTTLREERPKDVEVRVALVDLALRTKKEKQAGKLLDEAEKELGRGAALRLARARLLASAKGKKARTSINELADGADRLSDDDQSRVLSGLADVQLRVGNTDDARALWERLAQLPRHGGDLRLRLLLFDLALNDGDEARMDQALADIRKVEQSSGAFSRYGQALKLIWQVKNDKVERAKGLEQARLELDRALAQRPGWGPVFVARAEIAELTGRPEQAIRELNEAIRHGESSLAAIRRLAILYTSRHQDHEATILLNKVRRQVLARTDVGRIAMQAMARQGKFDQAVELARLSVSGGSTNPEDLVWAAKVKAAAGESAEAKGDLDKAVRANPKSALATVAMVQFLAEKKQKDEAFRVIEKAKTNLPEEQRPLALARCYQALGMRLEAQKHFVEAYQARRTDPAVVRAVAAAQLSGGMLREAEPLLRELVRGVPGKVADEDRAWAKRSLAIVLANGNDYRRFTEALSLVGLKLGANGQLLAGEGSREDLDLQRAQARVLASQNQQQFRKKAITLLEGLSRSRSLSNDDRFILALLYDRDGKALASREKLRELAHLPAPVPQYLAQYAMSLLVQTAGDDRRRPDDLAEAGRMIVLLEKVERDREVQPNDFASVELRARLLEARGKGKEAEALLVAHTGRPGARPEERLLVLASLARQKRYADAFIMCEELWQKGAEQGWKEGAVPPEAVGGVSVALLRVMKPSDAQVASIERHLRQASGKRPNSVVLLMHLADLLDKRGRYADAEGAYRRVLKKEPNNVVALNNLAWLLSQRSGDGEEALRLINRAVTGLGRRADLLDTRGLVHLARNQPDEALADLKAAAVEGPTPVRLFHLAKAHHQARNPGGARAALRQAREKGLDVTALHPVEREAARKLLAEYGMR